MPVLRENELFFALPEDYTPVDAGEASEHIKCNRGVLAVKYDPPRAKYGELFIPESGAKRNKFEQDLERWLDEYCEAFENQNLACIVSPFDKAKLIEIERHRMRLEAQQCRHEKDDGADVQMRLRADCGTVISVGLGVPVYPGERVLMRPYHGIWLDRIETPSGFTMDDVRFFGVTWDLEHSLCMVHRNGIWTPLYDWALIHRDGSQRMIQLARPGNKPKQPTGVVIRSGDECSYGENQRVCLATHPNVGVGFQFGDLKGWELVKQTNEDGIDQIYAGVE